MGHVCSEVHLWDEAESDNRADGSRSLWGGLGDWGGGGGGGGEVGLPEHGARRGRWKRVEGPATAPPGTAGMRPTRLGCWDREQALWAHLWKEEEEEWSEESGKWMGGVARETGWRWRWWWWLWRWVLGECQLSEVASSCLNQRLGDRQRYSKKGFF